MLSQPFEALRLDLQQRLDVATGRSQQPASSGGAWMRLPAFNLLTEALAWRLPGMNHAE